MFKKRGIHVCLVILILSRLISIATSAKLYFVNYFCSYISNFLFYLLNTCEIRANRVKQHQLEDLSRSKYSLAIPRNWVMRDKDKDYGIDAEVEIFDEKDRATGLVYLVQLKATETSDESAARKVDISIDAIKYYKSLELPVLIVRYSEKQDQFYCKWAHEIDLFYAKKGAKTRRVTFCDEDVWGEESAVDTEKYLKKLRAIKSGAITLPVPT